MGLVWEFDSHAQLSTHYRPTFPKWHGLDFDPQPTHNNCLVKLLYLIMKKESTRMYYGTLFILFVCHVPNHGYPHHSLGTSGKSLGIGVH